MVDLKLVSGVGITQTLPNCPQNSGDADIVHGPAQGVREAEMVARLETEQRSEYIGRKKTGRKAAPHEPPARKAHVPVFEVVQGDDDIGHELAGLGYISHREYENQAERWAAEAAQKMCPIRPVCFTFRTCYEWFDMPCLMGLN
jgi:hypothetical protein